MPPSAETFARGVPPPAPFIDIAGPPRERGQQYGEQARERILRGIGHYTAQLEGARLGWSDIEALVQTYEPTIADFEPAFVEEMRGIAEGAGVDFAAVVMLNARTELLKLADRRRKGQPALIDPDGCTGIAAMPAATRAGNLIHAQNWDWKVECAETAVVVRVRRDDGPDVLTFTEAGGLARSGMNAAGISITANYLESDRDYRQVGVPLALLRRKALEQTHLAHAMRIVYATPKSASNNVIVAQAGGICIDFECAPDETFQVHPQRGLLVHANHFQSSVALGKLKDTGIANTPDSLYRDVRVRELIEPRIGEITRETVKAALFDDYQSPWSVCRPPRMNTSNNLSASVAMVVMEPALGLMEVAMLPALNREFTSYRLDMEPHVRREAAAVRAA
ncbi:MAG TPA: C45 family peptidase [Ramlibacter sp.]|uniref:C45 family peptidase n=1 Tax=Ramlibacter sp. TaxID=1917967 RepID=UPI002BD3DF4F|nr:C45 family peptidase [Ramlibacter sp.]HVZ44471.1 C45 family peptidase [Ramlibacter sp.]